LVDPHGVKAVPGRKSDWMDARAAEAAYLRFVAAGISSRRAHPEVRTVDAATAELVCAAASQQQHMEKVWWFESAAGVGGQCSGGETRLGDYRAIFAGERWIRKCWWKTGVRAVPKSYDQEMKQPCTHYQEEDLFVPPAERGHMGISPGADPSM